MLVLDYAAAHDFVAKRRDARWDAWTIVLFKVSRAGATHPHGAYRDGVWGLETRIDPDNEGKWNIPHVRSITGTRA